MVCESSVIRGKKVSKQIREFRNFHNSKSTHAITQNIHVFFTFENLVKNVM